MNENTQTILQHAPQERAEYLADLESQLEYLNEQEGQNADMQNQLQNVSLALQQFSSLSSQMQILLQEKEKTQETIERLAEDNKALLSRLSQLEEKIVSLLPAEEEVEEEQEADISPLTQIDLSDKKIVQLAQYEMQAAQLVNLKLINAKRNNLESASVLDLVSTIEKMITKGTSSTSQVLNLYLEGSEEVDLIKQGYKKSQTGYYKHINNVVISVLYR